MDIDLMRLSLCTGSHYLFSKIAKVQAEGKGTRREAGSLSADRQVEEPWMEPHLLGE